MSHKYPVGKLLVNAALRFLCNYPITIQVRNYIYTNLPQPRRTTTDNLRARISESNNATKHTA